MAVKNRIKQKICSHIIPVDHDEGALAPSTDALSSAVCLRNQHGVHLARQRLGFNSKFSKTGIGKPYFWKYFRILQAGDSETNLKSKHFINWENLSFAYFNAYSRLGTANLT